MSGRPFQAPRDTATAERPDRTARLLLALLLTLGAGVVHAAAVPEHMRESPILGAVLLGTAAIQLVLAVTGMARPRRRVLVASAAVNLIAVMAWVVAHTTGVPVGLAIWRPEALSIPDFAAPTMELLAALLLLTVNRRRPRDRRSRAWLTALAMIPALLLAGILTAMGSLAAPDDTWLPAGDTVTPQAGRTTTLMYCSPGGMPRGMDVTEPAASAARPAPATLYVHGGGWILGDRQVSGPGANLAGQDGALFVPLRDELTRRGFVVVSIDYGLIPLHPWPAQIEDAKCAVRFMRAEAHRLGIDPNRIGAWGSSGGGHLVAMLGAAGPSAGFDVGQYLDQSSRVQAVVDMFGPTDLNAMGDSNWFGRLVMQIAFGSASTAEKAAASPVTYVGPGDPPFLILHGTDDVLVRPHHSQDLARRLEAAGVPATLVMVQHTGHSMATPGQQPTSEEVVTLVEDFFSRTLARR
jgi:acetyl esterase/lipase